MPHAPSFWQHGSLDVQHNTGIDQDRGNVRIVNVRNGLEHDSSLSVSMVMGHPTECLAPPSFQTPLQTLHGYPDSSAVDPATLQQNGYWPQPGDPVDARVAEFANQPQNAHCKALFCRLSEGTYLFGTHRTQLRLAPQTEQLEAFDEKSWVSMEEFVRRRSGSQMMHLQQASADADAC
jgi:hypothetical protein